MLDFINKFKIDVNINGYQKAIANAFINDLLKARWIVSTGPEDRGGGELGIRIAGFNLWYYKYSDPIVSNSIPYRIADKREFGETIKSIKYAHVVRDGARDEGCNCMDCYNMFQSVSRN